MRKTHFVRNLTFGCLINLTVFPSEHGEVHTTYQWNGRNKNQKGTEVILRSHLLLLSEFSAELRALYREIGLNIDEPSFVIYQNSVIELPFQRCGDTLPKILPLFILSLVLRHWRSKS